MTVNESEMISFLNRECVDKYFFVKFRHVIKKRFLIILNVTLNKDVSSIRDVRKNSVKDTRITIIQNNHYSSKKVQVR